MISRNEIRKYLILASIFLSFFLISAQTAGIGALVGKKTENIFLPNDSFYWGNISFFISAFAALAVLNFFSGEKRTIKFRLWMEGNLYLLMGGFACYFTNSCSLFIFGRIVQGAGAGFCVFFLLVLMKKTNNTIFHRLISLSSAGILAGILGGPLFALYVMNAGRATLDVFYWGIFVSLLSLTLVSRLIFELLLDVTEGIKNLFLFTYRKRRSLSVIAAGEIIYTTGSWLFDNPLYIFMIAYHGPLLGGGIMTFLSLIISVLTLLFYNWLKIDWVGVGIVEKIKEDGHKWTARLHSASFLTRILAFFPVQVFHLIRWALKKGDVAAFFALSVFEDPFLTTVYLRRGSFDGLKRKDWQIFIASVVVSNGYWIVRNTTIIEIARRIIF